MVTRGLSREFYGGILSQVEEIGALKCNFVVLVFSGRFWQISGQAEFLCSPEKFLEVDEQQSKDIMSKS